jgi:hypothetical protein
MIEHERETYERWLSQPTIIRELFDRYFAAEKSRIGWGKIQFTGRKKQTVD